MEVAIIPRIKYASQPGICCPGAEEGGEGGGGAVGKCWHLSVPYHWPSGTSVELKKNKAGLENEP